MSDLLKSFIKKAQRVSSLKKRGPKAKTWNVQVEYVSLQKMARLNGQYRGKNKPTDVLSFPSPEPFFSAGFLGELVICEPVMKRQAKEQGHSLKHENEVLLVHGFLHLLGFDHEKSPSQARVMAGWEKKLLGPDRGLITRVKSVRKGSRKRK